MKLENGHNFIPDYQESLPTNMKMKWNPSKRQTCLDL